MKKILKEQLKNYVAVDSFGGWDERIETIYNDLDHVILYRKKEADIDSTEVGDYKILASSRRGGISDFIINPESDYNLEFPDNKLIYNLL